jgi:pantothenate kinase
MNRVIVAVAKMKTQIADRLAQGLVTQAKIDATHKALDMELDEYVKFQELKSLASLDGKLSLDEAQTIYGYLGNTLEHFNDQPVEVKAALTQIFKELLSARIKAA